MATTVSPGGIKISHKVLERSCGNLANEIHSNVVFHVVYFGVMNPRQRVQLFTVRFHVDLDFPSESFLLRQWVWSGFVGVDDCMLL